MLVKLLYCMVKDKKSHKPEARAAVSVSHQDVTPVYLFGRPNFSNLHEGAQGSIESRFYLDSMCAGQAECLHPHCFYSLCNKQSQAW